jgi:glycosyltransferase involved in cell wall biosynthesis
MLKVIYISYDGILEPLGQSQILPYLKGLSEKGIKFFLVSFEKLEYSKDSNRVIALRRELDSCGIKWFRLTYHKRPPVLSTAYDIFLGFMLCASICLIKRPKLIHSRSYVASLIAWFLMKVFRMKFIFDMRGFWADERVEGMIWKSKNILYRSVKYIEKYLLKDADEIIVLTDKAKTILKDWGYGTVNVSVIPSCVDTSRFKFIEKSRMELRNSYGLTDKFVFMHTGSLEYWYMKDKMLDYFKSCSEIFPKAHFIILSYDNHDKIRKLISDKNLDLKNFTIMSVPFNRMPEYLSMADVGIFFITPVFSKSASSPTKFAEYLSCGLPVISNDRIGDIEGCVLNNNVGIIVRNFHDDEYKKSFKALIDLTQDKGLKERCRLTACNNFSHKSGVEKYYKIYSGLN